MAMSYKQNTTCGVQSRSLLSPSHPTTYGIEKELNDIKTCVLSSLSTSSKPTTEAVYEGLFKLSPLYKGIQELIKSLSSIQNESWVEELMDGLLSFLDVCGIMRDMVSELKGHVIALQCALRSRKGASTIENSMSQYKGLRKRIRKDVKRLIASVKIPMAATSEDHHHHHHALLIKRVKEVKEVTVIIFESLLSLLVMADSRRPVANKWPIIVSKLIKKTRVTCEEHHHRQQDERCRTTFDLEVLDVMSPIRYIKDGLSSWSYNKCQLKMVEAQLERIEDSLESIYIVLIRTRASLLNIVSHY